MIATLRRIFKRKSFSISGVPELRFGRVGWEQFRDRVVSPYQQNAWVQAAVNAKCTALGGVPFNVFTGKRGTKEKQALVETDPWVRLFQRPSPLYPSASEFIFGQMLYRDLFGEAPFIALGNDGEWKRGTVPAEIYIAYPPSIQEEVDQQTQMIARWRMSDASGQQILQPEQVGNFKRRHPSNPHRGLPPLDAARYGMDFSMAAQNFNTSLMRNGADPGGIVKTEGVADWGKEQHAAARMLWEDRHQGTDKAGRVAFLDKEADYQQLTANSKQMQLREHLEWSRDEIKAVLHVTDWELGSVQDFSYASAQQAQRTFWQGLKSEGQALEEFLWSWLFLPYSMSAGVNVWGEFDFASVPALRFEFTERTASIAALAPHYGINAINDRLALDMPKVAWGDEPAGVPAFGETEEAPPIVASKSYVASVKSWQETAERTMARAARDYFRGLRALALGEVRGKKSAAAAALLGDPKQWEAVAEVSFGPATAKIIDAMKRALKKQGFDVIPPDSELLKIAKSRMAQLVKVSKRDRAKLAARLKGLDTSDVDAMAKEIDKHFRTQNAGRSMTIARTEAGMVGGQVRQATFEANGVEKIQWSAARDEFTRESHARVDGEEVEIGKAFSNGLKHPSEPGAPAEEVINCRCVAVPA